MFKLTYDPKCKNPISDSKAELVVKLYFKTGVHLKVSTENVVYAFRTLVKEGQLPFDKVELWYKPTVGKAYKLDMNKDGNLNHWPNGFSDYVDNWLRRLVGWRIN